MSRQGLKASSPEELSRKLDLIMKRLDVLEAIVLENPEYSDLADALRVTKASLGLYADPLKMIVNAKTVKPPTEGESLSRIQVTLILKTQKVNVGEDIDLRLKVVNDGKAPVYLMEIENLSSKRFDLATKPSYSEFEGTSLNLKGRRIGPSSTEEVTLTIRSFDQGTFTIEPKIMYLDASGRQGFCRPEPVTVDISETILPGRISTGTKDLDNLLLGGIPEGYAVILTSPSCDEKDLVIDRFLRAGTIQKELTVHITIEDGVRRLAEENQSTFYLFLCNPQADRILKDQPNVFKLKGVENLTSISIALSRVLRDLEPERVPRKACIKVISDVLLQHGTVQTRRWLTDMIADLKAHGFTVLGVINPQMHSQREVHAILGLFDGEITIYEKELNGEVERFLKVRKMYGQEYIENELPVNKRRLQVK